MMDTRDTLTPEEFFKELRLNPKQRYAFVLGHGINYYLRNNVTSWKELLDKFIKGNLEELSFISQEKDIANTETANLIEFFADEEIKSGKPAAKMRDKLMCYLDERLNNDGPDQCALLDAA